MLCRGQEEDLETRQNLLEKELRKYTSIEDWAKTKEQRERERILLEQFLEIVQQRNQVVEDLDVHEQGY